MAAEQELTSPLIHPISSTQRWFVFLKERFPLGTHILLIGGFAVSGAFLSGWDKNTEGVIMALIGFFLFFVELRIMDELKDYKKDLSAHPERPLPRGLIQLGEAREMVRTLLNSMFGFSVVLVLVCNLLSGLLFFCITLYLKLMYREFYLGDRLGKYPFFYAFTHQLILFPLCFFTSAVHHPAMVFDEDGFAYAIATFGAFFAYELCRKLDPKAPLILKNYATHYGPRKTVLVATLLLGTAAYGAFHLNARFLWGIEVLTTASLIVYLRDSRKFKTVETFAGLSLVLHVWAPAIHFLLKKFIH
ncbi:MAG: hypothetical protein HYX41_00040 [Bdellovibrio sp.]|nr:hypothetical protein [Bdellovibrio sp.]